MKNSIIGFVVGVCVVVTAYTVYSFVQLNKVVSADSATLTQVVGFLNQQIAATQKQAPVVKK